MSGKTTVSLGSALDIMHASSLKERLTASLEKKSQIVLISDKVERVDTAGLQLIYAFRLEAQARKKQVTWKGPSAALLKASDSLGMTSALELLG